MLCFTLPPNFEPVQMVQSGTYALYLYGVPNGMVVARQTVYHEKGRASYVDLPVVIG